MSDDRKWAFTDADRDDEFDQHYERLAALGVCDSPGGAEHARVKDEWIAAKRPPIVTFIRQRASGVPFMRGVDA